MATPTLIATRGAADYQALIPTRDRRARPHRRRQEPPNCAQRRVHARARPSVDRRRARRRQRTTLAHALARALGLSYTIAFSSHERPAARRHPRRIGVSPRQQAGSSSTKGPVFSQLVLADEINRATPKAQSALLEAMEERQVTGGRHDVFAPRRRSSSLPLRKSPHTQIGTFPCPNHNSTAFSCRSSSAIRHRTNERALLANGERRVLVEQQQPVVSLDALLRLQDQVGKVHVSEPLPRLRASVARLHARVRRVRRGALAARRHRHAARGAGLGARETATAACTPEDLQAVLGSIVAHPAATRAR